MLRVLGRLFTRPLASPLQRRAERRWEAYLAGGAGGAGAAAAAAQQQQQQQQQQRAEEDEEPQGASPKRPLEEDTHTLLLPGSPLARQGAGKRQRGASAAEGPASAAPALTGFEGGQPGSPFGARGRTPSIATQLTDVHLTQQTQKAQQQAAGGGAPATAVIDGDGCGGAGEASLAACLQAALGRCVEAGLLPGLAYPLLKVQRATARQQKVLPPGVAFTSPFPLAAAGAINKAAKRDGAAAGPPSSSNGNGGGGCGATPDSVAAALLAHCQLPPGLSAAALKGHINISGAATGAIDASPAAAEPAAGPQPHAGRAGGSSPGAAAAAEGGSSGHLSPRAAALQAAAAAAAAAGASCQVPRGVPRHYEFRMLRSSDPSLLSVEFQLWRKYQVRGGRGAAAALPGH